MTEQSDELAQLAVQEQALLASGPIDYIVVEYADHKPTGEAFEELLKLVDAGLIRVLDLAFVRKNDDGSVVGLSWQDGRHPRVGEHLGRPVRVGRSPLGRRAGGQRPHPRPGHPGRARNRGLNPCPD